MLAEVLKDKAPNTTQEDAGSKGGAVKQKPKRAKKEVKAAEVKAADVSSSLSTIGVEDVISPSDALGAESVRKAGNREMLVFAQNRAALLRRQEALFRQASAFIDKVPEERREGVRQAMMVYAQNVRSWQLQTQEQEAAFLAAQDKDQQARARFMLAESALTDAAQKKRMGIPFFSFRQRRKQVLASMEQAREHSAAVREALNEQGLAIHRYMRFHAEWRQSIEEMMAFVAEQAGF